MGFEDGDGNFGLGAGRHHRGLLSWHAPYHHNVFCDYQELRDGAWVTVQLRSTPNSAKCPSTIARRSSTPTGQNNTAARDHHRCTSSPATT